LIAVASEQKLALYRACGSIIRGWARARSGEGREGTKDLCKALDFYTETKTTMLLSYFRAVMADCYYRSGQFELALATVDGALSISDQTAEQFWCPAILQLKGEIVLALDHCDQGHAESCFEEALALARRQSAKSLELRAAMSLGRLWRDQRRRAEAHDLLAPVYVWFTEGFDTVDLKQARALLDDLS
jgi:predicted ATPase